MSSFDNPPPLRGLLVAGGKSRRMGKDKTGLPTAEGPLWQRSLALLRKVCPESYVSIRPGQHLTGWVVDEAPLLEDRIPDAGPLSGILTAFDEEPGSAWLVLACDLPLLDQSTLEALVAARQPSQLATAYRSNFDGKPEPLCTIYEPAAAPLLRNSLGGEHPCPRRFLMNHVDQVTLISLAQPYALENANTPEDLARIQALNAGAHP